MTLHANQKNDFICGYKMLSTHLRFFHLWKIFIDILQKNDMESR